MDDNIFLIYWFTSSISWDHWEYILIVSYLNNPLIVLECCCSLLQKNVLNLLPIPLLRFFIFFIAHCSCSVIIAKSFLFLNLVITPGQLLPDLASEYFLKNSRESYCYTVLKNKLIIECTPVWIQEILFNSSFFDPFNEKIATSLNNKRHTEWVIERTELCVYLAAASCARFRD